MTNSELLNRLTVLANCGKKTDIVLFAPLMPGYAWEYVDDLTERYNDPVSRLAGQDGAVTSQDLLDFLALFRAMAAQVEEGGAHREV